MVAKHLHEEPLPPSKCSELDIPADLDAVVMDCLRKNPDDRPGSAGELAERLAGCRVGDWSPRKAKDWWRLRIGNDEK